MITTTRREGTYQMLWDCPACGTRKLLGVDHRHCPCCGSAQEENLRYFPGEHDWVATDFRGVEPDWECRHCGTPTGSGARHCGGCGAPRGDAPSVHVRPSIPSEQAETGELAAQQWRERRAAARAAAMPTHAAWRREAGKRLASLGALALRWWRAALIGVAALASLVLVCSMLGDTEVPLRVASHSWSRSIPVERYTTVHKTEWCDSMPADAREQARARELHHHDRVPDGQDCHTVPASCITSCRNVDNGNGSFSKVCTDECTPSRDECTTRYREVPVYADKCQFDVDRWVVARTARRNGGGRSPKWPDEPEHATCTETALGCERLGYRSAVYRIHLVTEGEAHEHRMFDCEFNEHRWGSTPVDARFVGPVSKLSGELDCDALETAAG